MNAAIAFGLTAALCWGAGDFCARGSARAGGTFLTLLAIQVVAVGAFLLLAWPLDLFSGSWHAGAVLAAVGVGLLIMAGAGLLYRAFAIGTLALVSPICASFAAITALLAIATGERPLAAQLVGIALTMGGVALAATAPAPTRASAVAVAAAASGAGSHAGAWPTGEVALAEAPAGGPGGVPVAARPRWRRAPGLVEALAAMLVFGVGYWAQHYVVVALGGIPAAFVAKVGDLVALGALALLALWARRHGRRMLPASWRLASPPGRFWLFVVPSALFDTTANVAYNLGVAHALTSLVVVLASLFSAVTVLLAWVFLGERLARWQWVGVAAILAGVALVSA